MISDKLLNLVSNMNLPLAENFSVINTFASESERYFHYPYFEKWRRKLVMLQPEEGDVSVIDLPEVLDMLDSQIF